MPDLLKPCGIVFPMQQQMNNTESDQLIQEMLIDAKHCEIYEQSSSNFITLDAVTPITPPFTIHTVVTDDDGGATSKCSSSEKYEKASSYFNEQTGIILCLHNRGAHLIHLRNFLTHFFSSPT